jgi:hypothetical protein
MRYNSKYLVFWIVVRIILPEYRLSDRWSRPLLNESWCRARPNLCHSIRHIFFLIVRLGSSRLHDFVGLLLFWRDASYKLCGLISSEIIFFIWTVIHIMMALLGVNIFTMTFLWTCLRTYLSHFYNLWINFSWWSHFHRRERLFRWLLYSWGTWFDWRHLFNWTGDLWFFWRFRLFWYVKWKRLLRLRIALFSSSYFSSPLFNLLFVLSDKVL